MVNRRIIIASINTWGSSFEASFCEQSDFLHQYESLVKGILSSLQEWSRIFSFSTLMEVQSECIANSPPSKQENLDEQAWVSRTPVLLASTNRHRCWIAIFLQMSITYYFPIYNLFFPFFFPIDFLLNQNLVRPNVRYWQIQIALINYYSLLNIYLHRHLYSADFSM